MDGSIFDSSCIHSAYANTKSMFARPHTIVQAEFFADQSRDIEEYENKCLIAVLLGITRPSPKGNTFGRSPSARITAGKRTAVPPKHTQTMYILTFGDYSNMPNTFALVVPTKHAFQTMFGGGGADVRQADLVKVGDKFVIKNPPRTNETLGGTMIIIRQPMCVAKLVEMSWPCHPMTTSNDHDFQIFWHCRVAKIAVQNIALLMNRDSPVLTCTNFTCDRQLPCKGCFGKSPTPKPIVLSCTVIVYEQYSYNSTDGKATFENFTSYEFSKLFFEDLRGLSQKCKTPITQWYTVMEDSILRNVEYVNNHGGWDIHGWHRSGTITDEDTGDAFISSDTKGHIVQLKPYDQNVLNKGLDGRKFRNPSDDITPKEAMWPPSTQSRNGVPTERERYEVSLDRSKRRRQERTTDPDSSTTSVSTCSRTTRSTRRFHNNKDSGDRIQESSRRMGSARDGQQHRTSRTQRHLSPYPRGRRPAASPLCRDSSDENEFQGGSECDDGEAFNNASPEDGDAEEDGDDDDDDGDAEEDEDDDDGDGEELSSADEGQRQHHDVEESEGGDDYQDDRVAVDLEDDGDDAPFIAQRRRVPGRHILDDSDDDEPTVKYRPSYPSVLQDTDDEPSSGGEHGKQPQRPDGLEEDGEGDEAVSVNTAAEHTGELQAPYPAEDDDGTRRATSTLTTLADAAVARSTSLP